MGDHRQPSRPTGRRDRSGELPPWLTAFVVVSLVLLLGYNIVVVGPQGLPTSYILGGLLGAYAGVDQLLKRRNDSSGNGTSNGGSGGDKGA